MVGRHQRLNGHESEQTPGDSKGQRSLVCCSPWDGKHDLGTEQQQTCFPALQSVADGMQNQRGPLEQ